MAQVQISEKKSRLSKLKWLIPLIMLAIAVLAWPGQAAQPGAKEKESEKEKAKPSPRHQEWVSLKHDSRTVECFIVYPQAETTRPAVIIIHENQGLTDWVRKLADEVAAAGYIAVAPDLLSGMAPNGGRTTDFANTEAALEAIYKLPQNQVTADLNRVADHTRNLKAWNGKMVVAGFCWGGSQAFEFATVRHDLAAAYVFYGAAPTDIAKLKQITCPVYGFYAGDDARVTSTVGETEKQMKEAGKTFEPVTYPKAAHAFMRLGETAKPGDPNRRARDEAWKRWTDLLKKI
jgi:carboxymethylenebutenolidase